MKKDMSRSSQDIRSAIVENKMVAPDIYLLTLNAKAISAVARPGQFAMIKVTDVHCNDPLLRRPLSIHNISADKIQFLYKVLGRGTEILAASKSGMEIQCLAPLGNGFKIPSGGSKSHCLVGGGMGIAPLLFLAKHIRESQPGDTVHVLLGARNKKELIAVEDFSRVGISELKIATDDGSEGHLGLVTELLDKGVWSKDEVNVYSCGPEPMMKAVAGICQKRGWNCQVSLEALMACGMGACLGCAVSQKGLGEENYLHVCSDGPVFSAQEIW
jgi:dihydroorotate dehydrogenase electron transfer subunit